MPAFRVSHALDCEPVRARRASAILDDRLQAVRGVSTESPRDGAQQIQI